MLSQEKILVVEDNELNRTMLVEILSGQYATLEAENGQAALDILQTHTDDVALILLDIVMPVMDGYTFLDILKKDSQLSLIPVIIMTQNASEDAEVAALSHGATDFIPKPYRPQVILHRVASIIHLRETASMINQFRYDQLTGLYSKEFFYQQAQAVLMSNPDREYSIVCSNIVNFKLYNDTFGIAAGDQLLKRIARGINEQLGAGGVTGRYSADRFVCLQEREKAQTAQALIARHMNFPEELKSVELKWGVYEIHDRFLPLEYMCDRALLAADSIKGQYDQTIAVYDDALRRKLLREQSITSNMESALENSQFTVYLQPKYRASDSQLCGAEALVRWVHPEWGFMSPGEFIPLFERNGFIYQLDRFVWEQACVLLHRWQEAGYPPLPVSVNVSRADVCQPDLVDFLLELTQKYGIDPKLLHLEITESAYTENSKQIIATVDALRAKGFIIEMDDFGSGYSSLNMLSQLKLDILKLDMKFVQSETSQSADRGILRLIVEMAHRMNLSVVAEGVETQHQLSRLQEIGCDYVQGYLFSKPVPHVQYGELLENFSQRQDVPLPASPGSAGAKQFLLIAEEDSRCRNLLAEAFADVYQVVQAKNCEQAQAFLSENANGLAAMILSGSLPEPGAASVVSALRRVTAPRHIPIMIATTFQQEPQIQELGLDVDDISYKPRDIQCTRCLRKRVEWMNTLNAYKSRERSMISEACRDYLTGLLNRRGFQSALDAMQSEDYPMAVFLLRLDDLKHGNDSLSHATGDKLLKHFASVLRQNTRNGDVLCRYGDDEFAVILKGMRLASAVLRKGEDIVRDTSKFILPDGTGAVCSGGVVLCENAEVPMATLLERADQALYQAKRQHKGGCVLWEGDVACPSGKA